jgi:hypothetical protein
VNKPLQLLLNCDVETAVQQVSKFVADNQFVHIYSDSTVHGPSWRVIYKGITFGCEVTTVSADISDFERIFCSAEPSSAKSALSIDLDDILVNGARISPISAALLEIGAYFCQYLKPVTVAWAPGRISTDPAYFSEAVWDYVNGGVFPALAVIEFQFSSHDDTIRTRGLDWFSGQELELKGSGLTKADLARRAVRLIHDIVINGPISKSETVPDVEPDNRLTLTLALDGALVIGEIFSDPGLAR